MRPLAALFLLATPAAAWDFSPVPVCTLSHEAPGLSLRVTYDPAQPQPYAIALTRTAPWPRTPAFAIRFDGPAGMTITTDRHRLSPDGRTLTVTDTGFGNVLDGLEFNRTATATAGPAEAPLDLAAAAPAVRDFRACLTAPIA